MRALKDRVHVNLGGESRTEQSHVKEVDINKIMAKAQRGQHDDYIKEHAGHYGDASSLNYLEANIIVANANTMFEELPSAIRSKFENKPEKFLDFVQNPDNQEEMIKLKLAKRKVLDPQPTPTQPAPKAETKSETPTGKKPEAIPAKTTPVEPAE